MSRVYGWLIFFRCKLNFSWQIATKADLLFQFCAHKSTYWLTVKCTKLLLKQTGQYEIISHFQCDFQRNSKLIWGWNAKLAGWKQLFRSCDNNNNLFYRHHLYAVIVLLFKLLRCVQHWNTQICFVWTNLESFKHFLSFYYNFFFLLSDFFPLLFRPGRVKLVVNENYKVWGFESETC